MGGAFSTGQDNDELIDYLVESGYIKSKKIERVFRSIDRGDYYSTSERQNAYNNFPLQHGFIHLSAPSIYSEVMEELELQPGLSFLNLGSGSGYLSTMVGLLLGHNGINHGVEISDDCVKYAYKRLEEFKETSLALDVFDFCEPVFVQGNCLSLESGRRYDRVYCGATCQESSRRQINEFLKVGGILVMPYRDYLVKVTRVDEVTWAESHLLPVTFSNLISPIEVPDAANSVYPLPRCDPLSLQELCRGKIRCRLQDNVWAEHSDFETVKPITQKQQNATSRTLHQLVLPTFQDSDGNESDENLSNDDREQADDRPRLIFGIDGPLDDNLCRFLLLAGSVFDGHGIGHTDSSISEEDDDMSSWEDDDDEDAHSDNFSIEGATQDSNISWDGGNSGCSAAQKDEKKNVSWNSGWNISQSDDDEMSSSERETQDSNSSSNSARKKSQSENAEANNTSWTSDQDQRKKSNSLPGNFVNRKVKADSTRIENTVNSAANGSADSDFSNGTPVKHKRRNNSSTPDSRGSTEESSEHEKGKDAASTSSLHPRKESTSSPRKNTNRKVKSDGSKVKKTVNTSNDAANAKHKRRINTTTRSKSSNNQSREHEKGKDAASTSSEHPRKESTSSPGKSANRKVKADSDKAKNAGNTSNDAASVSADSDFSNGTPVKHKRRNNSSTCSKARNNESNDFSPYSKMSKSDSEHEEVDESTPSPRKKANRKGKSDSGIVDDASVSADSDFTLGTPKHKRKNNAATPDSRSSNDESSDKQDHSEKTHCTKCHYLDKAAFSACMIKKIRQLPVPDALKVYINYNRHM